MRGFGVRNDRCFGLAGCCLLIVDEDVSGR